MDSTSSTSSSEREAPGFPWALAIALAATLALGVAVGLAADRFANEEILTGRYKLARAAAGPAEDVMVLGDSQGTTAVLPEVLAAALPAGTRVFNYGMPSAGPSGGATLLETYLEAHEPPALVVVAYNPVLWMDDEHMFGHELRHLFDFEAALRASRLTGRPSVLMTWLESRLPTLRHRVDLRTLLASLVLDALPSWRPWARAALGLHTHAADRFRFAWRYTDRLARNRRFLETLERNRGWVYWKVGAHPGGVLPATLEWRDDPFVRGPRAAEAMDRMLSTCAAAGIPVVLLAVPVADWVRQSLSPDGGAGRLEAYWSELAGRPGVVAMDSPWSVYENRLFSDVSHSNPRGARRFSESIAPLVAETFGR